MRFVTRRRIALTVTLVSIVIGAAALRGIGQGSVETNNVVELTQADLFSSPNWQQMYISVDGFTIGMTELKALETARANKLKLLPQRLEAVRDTFGPCREGECDVYNDTGNSIGVVLFFEADHVSKINVSVPSDADPEVKKINVARSFKGLTHQFFNNYSDALREKLLGRVEGKRTHDVLSGRADTFFTHIEYDYPQLGISVHVTVSERDPKPFDLEVDLLPRHEQPR